MSNITEVIDIESYAKEGKTVPMGHHYQIKVDKMNYIVSESQLSGREILKLADKTPEKYILRQKVKNQVVEISPDELVDFTKPGVERFMTIPNEVQEGEALTIRREFEPLKYDAEFLESLDLSYETILDNGGTRRVVIHGFPIPEGYNVTEASVFVYLPPGYPDTQIDMAYFYPNLSRLDGKAIGGLSPVEFDGKLWQQWSRHRTGLSTWRIGEDNLSNHFALVADWLKKELVK